MGSRQFIYLALIIVFLVVIYFIFKKVPEKEVTSSYDLNKAMKQIVKVDLTFDTSKLYLEDKKVLEKLLETSKYIDEIYKQQIYYDTSALQAKLSKSNSKTAKDILWLLNFNLQPWDGMNHWEPFIDGVGPKPKGANFYQTDLTQEEFEKYVATLTDEEKAVFNDANTVIRKDANGKLYAKPYSEEYKEYLEPLCKLLEDAANLTNDAKLKDFLLAKVKALKTNKLEDYRESEAKWLVADGKVQPTIGPYEQYEDEIAGVKAAFESFICVRDDEKTEEFKKYMAYANEFEENLPIDDSLRKKFAAVSQSSYMSFADLVQSAGDANHGVKTIAFNLPNDSFVRETHGSKKVQMVNVMKAKFDNILVPIAKNILSPEQLKYLDFNAFMTVTLQHEVSHGLGPVLLVVDKGDGTTEKVDTSVYYPGGKIFRVEEARADMTGLYNIGYLTEKGVYEPEFLTKVYVTYAANLLRGMRFGIHRAHGAADLFSYLYFKKAGAVEYDAEKKLLHVNLEKMPEAIRGVTKELNELIANQDKDALVKYVVDRVGTNKEEAKTKIPSEINALKEKLSDVPVDIEFNFVIDKKIG